MIEALYIGLSLGGLAVTRWLVTLPLPFTQRPVQPPLVSYALTDPGNHDWIGLA